MRGAWVSRVSGAIYGDDAVLGSRSQQHARGMKTQAVDGTYALTNETIVIPAVQTHQQVAQYQVQSSIINPQQ